LVPGEAAPRSSGEPGAGSVLDAGAGRTTVVVDSTVGGDERLAGTFPLAEPTAAGRVSAPPASDQGDRNVFRFGGASVGVSVRSGGVVNSTFLPAFAPALTFESEAG
jgi:hypothetical protein